MKIKFTKMQAYGNDYVYMDAIHQSLPELNQLAKAVSDRHFGIGSDGMVLICPSHACDFRMRIFNPDGSEAEMCGNALRSTAKFVYHHGLTTKRDLIIETAGGHQSVQLEVKDGSVVNIKANIGRPELRARKIPVNTELEIYHEQELRIPGRTYLASSLSWGNPHTVLLVKDVDTLDLETDGPLVEHHENFPERTNVTFVQPVDQTHARIREWERGTGETMGCGTGCCSAVVVLNRMGLCGKSVDVEQPGGVLRVDWDEAGMVHMTGPSHVVYEGEYHYEA